MSIALFYVGRNVMFCPESSKCHQNVCEIAKLAVSIVDTHDKTTELRTCYISMRTAWYTGFLLYTFRLATPPEELFSMW